MEGVFQFHWREAKNREVTLCSLDLFGSPQRHQSFLRRQARSPWDAMKLEVKYKVGGEKGLGGRWGLQTWSRQSNEVTGPLRSASLGHSSLLPPCSYTNSKYFNNNQFQGLQKVINANYLQYVTSARHR